MDIFNFCWFSLLNECKKCNISVDKIKYDIATYDIDFDVMENRLAFIYKLGTFNILFIEKCLKTLKDEYHETFRIVERLCTKENLKICSLSNVLFTDITGLLYALSKLNKPFKESVSLNVINKYDSCQSLLKLMTCSEGNAKCIPLKFNDTSGRNLKFIQCDIPNSISPEAKFCLKNSDIVLMVRAFSSKIDNVIFSRILLNILTFLKPGALLFFVDSKKKSKKFVKINNCGVFLFGPKEIELQDVPINKKICEIVGAEPLQSGAAQFAVWQKKSYVKALPNYDNENLSVTSKNINSISDVCSASCEQANRRDISKDFDNEQSISSINSNSILFYKSELLSDIDLASLKNENYELNSETGKGNKKTVASLVMNCENLISRLEELVENISQCMQETKNCCNSPKHEMPIHLKNSCCFNNRYEKLYCHRFCCTRNRCCPKEISSCCTFCSFQCANNCKSHTTYS